MVLPLIQYYVDQFGNEEEIDGFVNNVGDKEDVKIIMELWKHFGWSNQGYFSIGFDCRGADCTDIFGNKLILPYQEIARRMADAEFGYKRFSPLTIKQVKDIFI